MTRTSLFIGCHLIKEIEMSTYWRVALFAVCLLLIPAGLFAQAGDICSRLPSVDDVRAVNSSSNGTVTPAGTNSEVVVQQMRERAEMQARLEKERANWTVQLIPVK